MGRMITRAEKNIAWIEKHCFIPEGFDVGKPVRLRQWQKNEIIKIYDNPARTRTAIISFGRKNAKTTLSAFLLLLHLCGPEAKRNSQLYSAAQSRDQAAIIFKLAAKIVRMSPALNPVVTVRDAAKELACKELGTFYKALSAEASTAYGLSPIFTIHDELGQVRGPTSELYEALETAVGAQANPLTIIISTQAPSDGDLLSILIDDAIAAHDPRIVYSLYTAPMEDPPFEETTIMKANPAYGDFLNSELVLDMARSAARISSREPEFRNLVLNQRVQMNQPFISRSAWMACGSDPEPFGNLPVFAGLDLSQISDLTAFVCVCWTGNKLSVKPTFWMPGEGIEERSHTDRTPYNIWHKDGFIEATPGPTVQYEWVAFQIKEFCNKHNVKKIAFDRWEFRHLRPWLLKAGFSERSICDIFDEFGQGYMSMSPALRTLEGVILDEHLAHGNHPVLTSHAANAVVQSDPAGNRKLTKLKSNGKIDGMVALAMAVAVAEQNRHTSLGLTQTRGVMVL